ncbi:hypothetical protein CMT41_16590 [Colwellia sp. MT41]|uniref:response regulator n=1 Tax=Colwellia sp. MT41 TaxID=58049 RepID=UPI000717B578|nr:response regulator [Colwellia sp. MT41]ALO36167.1 hypothetical protein CMT41_16590 [Colwellia sp. MT41]
MFNIMIIDDSKVALKITEEILSKEVNAQLNIRKFSCAVEAKNKLLLFQPDLVITDIEMPNTNGYEVIEFIKEISDVPIIAVSGSTLKKNDTATILHVANLIGADFTLTKNDIRSKLSDLVMSIFCKEKDR